MKDCPLFDFQAPSKANDTRYFGNLIGASLPMTIAECAEKERKFILLVVQDNQTALKLQPQIKQFTSHCCDIFPDWETLPYDNFSPHQDIISDRIAHLFRCLNKIPAFSSYQSPHLLHRVMPRSFLLQHALMIKKGDQFSIEKLRIQLDASGYRHVDQVIEHGEYANRGSILDLFPMGSEHPYRIDFF